ncbi:MAG TPA: response regulator transcription factor [Acidimicrobiales bacterium]|nr:response regulator transcription factor [Acidimicrobiales bacterium]
MTEVAVNVLVVDDQAPFRAAERAVLSRLPGFALVGEAASGEEAIEMAGALAPDLVLMDINMGEVDGIEATRRIVTGRPATKVILVSTYALDELPATARTSGAVGYVNKDELSPKAIRRIWESGGDAAWMGD